MRFVHFLKAMAHLKGPLNCTTLLQTDLHSAHGELTLSSMHRGCIMLTSILTGDHLLLQGNPQANNAQGHGMDIHAYLRCVLAAATLTSITFFIMHVLLNIGQAGGFCAVPEGGSV